nr:transposase, MuDR, MULE transposase domain protein [Tanacetum cinerariifolium]
MMNGSHEDLFSQLPYYCYNLELANESTITHIHTDADGCFEMLSVGFAFAIRSFLQYMMPLIIIYGAHLKGNYSGTNLLAVGMDGNNQILPLATVVSQGETGESWTWFLSRLKDQIGEPPNLCIISDRHADFDKAISELRTYRPEAVNKLEQAEALVHELSDWVAAKVYGRMLKSAKWTVKGIDPLQLYQVCNTKEGHQATTKHRQEHLSQLLLKFHKDMNSYVIWDKDRISTQEYMKELVEDVGEDGDFKSGPWVNATDYVNAMVAFYYESPLSKIPGKIHYKVLDEGTYGKNITV